MSPDFREYCGNGLENDFQFRCDFIFATEVLAFVKDRSDGNRWLLWKCQRVSLGAYVVTFKTNEYLNPSSPTATLNVKVVSSNDIPYGWDLSFC